MAFASTFIFSASEHYLTSRKAPHSKPCPRIGSRGSITKARDPIGKVSRGSSLTRPRLIVSFRESQTSRRAEPPSSRLQRRFGNDMTPQEIRQIVESVIADKQIASY